VVTLLTLSRLLTSIVLAYAGVTKLASPGTLATAAESLGLRPLLARLLGRFLAPLELAVAALLLAGATAWIGAVAALVLFGGFSVLIAWNLRRGQRPACACFGEASSAPISEWTLVRNLSFSGLALFVVAQGPAGAGPGLLTFAASLVGRVGLETSMAAIGLLVLAQALGVLVLLTRMQRAAESPAPVAVSDETQLTGWPPGVRAPQFDLPDLDGQRVTLVGLLAGGREVVLFFTDPACRPCDALLPEIGRWQEAYGELLTFAVLSQGTPSANREKIHAYGVQTVLLQGGNEVASAYRCPGTPGAVIVDRDGRIASRVASGGTAIRQVVDAGAQRAAVNAPESVTSPPPPPDAGLLGDPAPPFRLPSLAGGEVDLMEFGGRLALLVFWSPTCGWCLKLKPELQAWERSESGAITPTVILTTGSRDVNEGQGFLSPVLLDDGGLVARAYGATRTPGAILVDAEGAIASQLAEGGAGVMELARKSDALSRAASLLATRVPGAAGSPAA
jgi:peroxiredoxin/uncharacterized membrane protein YphA (DoxX/SURF4 family)